MPVVILQMSYAAACADDADKIAAACLLVCALYLRPGRGYLSPAYDELVYLILDEERVYIASGSKVLHRSVVYNLLLSTGHI